MRSVLPGQAIRGPIAYWVAAADHVLHDAERHWLADLPLILRDTLTVAVGAPPRGAVLLSGRCHL